MLILDHRLEDLKINCIIYSVMVFLAIMLCAFADFYHCAIIDLYRPLGYLVVNYFAPIFIVYGAGMLGVKHDIKYFNVLAIAIFWFVFFTIMNAHLAYCLPF